MTQPTENGKKYVQLTENILLEYVYVNDRYVYSVTQDIDDDLLANDGFNYYNTYGRSDISTYRITYNDYTKERYFMNDIQNSDLTNNSLLNTVLPIRKDCTKWVSMLPVNQKFYSHYDERWSDIKEQGESSIRYTPSNTEYVPYDIVRIYFQSGYHTEYDGFIYNIYTKNRNGEYINLLTVRQQNTDNMRMTTTPFWFADKIYTNYVEYRVPSVAYISSEKVNATTDSMYENGWSVQGGEIYDRANPKPETLPYYLTNSLGFFQNPTIGIDLYGVDGNELSHNFEVLKTKLLTSTMIPNKDTYDKLFATIRQADDGDYFKIYTYYEQNPSDRVYEPTSLYQYLSMFKNTFSLVHQITVTETYTNDDNETVTEQQTPMTYIQTWESVSDMYENGISPEIKFRPVLEHASHMIGQNDGAKITYVIRLINNADSTSIIKGCDTSIIRPRRFGLSMINATLHNTNDVHVYNRVENSSKLTLSIVNKPLGALNRNDNAVIQVNKYVTSSFIDRRNVKVTVSPIRVSEVTENNE